MRTYIGPIGFNSTSVTRPILGHGLEDGDVVTLVRPEEETNDRRAEETMADVDRTLGALEPEISTSVERVPHDDFQDAVLSCHDLIRDASRDRILVLGGGARDVYLPLAVAGLSALDCISLVLTYSDIDGAFRELELPNLRAKCSDHALETLAIVGRESTVSLPTVTDDSDFSKSTVTRHVNRLAEQGAVETWMEGRTKNARLTTTGRLLLEASQENE